MALAWSQNLRDRVSGSLGFETVGSYQPAEIVVNKIITPSWSASSPLIESGASTQAIIEQNRNLERLSGLLSESTQTLIHQNLIGLGEASVNISTALNEQVGIREAQRAETVSTIDQLGNWVENINQRLSTQTTELGEAVTEVSEAVQTEAGQVEAGSIFSGLGLPSMQQLKLPLLIAGVGIAALFGWKILK